MCGGGDREGRGLGATPSVKKIAFKWIKKGGRERTSNKGQKKKKKKREREKSNALLLLSLHTHKHKYKHTHTHTHTVKVVGIRDAFSAFGESQKEEGSLELVSFVLTTQVPRPSSLGLHWTILHHVREVAMWLPFPLTQKKKRKENYSHTSYPYFLLFSSFSLSK